MDNTIKHEGIVERIENGIAYVKIIQHSACSGCHVKAACTIADQQEKIIETVCSGCNIKIGERVFIVRNNEPKGFKTGNHISVFLSFRHTLHCIRFFCK